MARTSNACPGHTRPPARLGTIVASLRLGHRALTLALRPAALFPASARTRFDADGWLAGARRVPSPHCDARPPGATVSLVVVHNISLPPGEFGGDGVERLFTNRLDPAAHPYYATIAHLRVSAHFFVRRDGGVVQFVPCGMRAWHAGVSSWRGRERCNDFSVGIELEGTDTRPFTVRQYHRLARLVRGLHSHYPIEHVTGHSDIAPERKTDPGAAFEWRRLASLLGLPARMRS